MPSPPRILIPGTTVLITTRTEEGLPFVPTDYMELILESAMARAMTLYPVILCHYLWMANHFHLIAFVQDPKVIEEFVCRVKTESAHAINRLLGRRRRTIWVGDYDSVPILTVEDVIKKIKYLYLNPGDANSADSIEKYRRPSSWKAFTSGRKILSVPWIQRFFLSPATQMDPNAVTTLRKKAVTFHELKIEPNAWMNSFGILDPVAQDKINSTICREVLETEAGLRANRKTVPADEQHPRIVNDIGRPYVPKKYSRRMWCICSDAKIKIAFILFIKTLLSEGKEILKRWRSGEINAAYPPGIAPPSFPRLANLIRYRSPVFT